VDLGISSYCSRTIVEFILRYCPNVERLSIGGNVDLTDEGLARILLDNPMHRLKVLHIFGSSHLTLASLNLLVATCHSLTEIKGLPYWTHLTKQQLEQFEAWLKENNIDIDVEEQKMVDQGLFFNKYEFDEKEKEELRIYFSTA